MTNRAEHPVLFIGGCSGSNTPPSAQITHHYILKQEPVIKPFSRAVFGTHTTSFGIVAGEIGIFIDNGDGVQHVAEFLMKSGVKKVFGLQTHFHKDHKSGIQENKLLFTKGLVEKIFAPRLGKKTFAEIFAADFAPETYPVCPATFGVTHTFEDFNCGETLPILGGVKTLAMNHPGGAAGYRIQMPEGDVVIVTDNEIRTGEDAREYANFISGAKIVYVDMQYRDVEYQGKAPIGKGPAFPRIGWGHSTPSLFLGAIALCERLPEKVLVGHHDPKRSDEDLQRFEEEVQKEASLSGVNLEFARGCTLHEI